MWLIAHIYILDKTVMKSRNVLPDHIIPLHMDYIFGTPYTEAKKLSLGLRLLIWKGVA
jgi:hypothetical protein